MSTFTGHPEPSADEQFVVVWHETEDTPARVSLENGTWVSKVYDMADCDADEGVRDILALDENGLLVPVTLGEQVRINTDQEYPFYYAQALIMAGTRIAGYVAFTDH